MALKVAKSASEIWNTTNLQTHALTQQCGLLYTGESSFKAISDYNLKSGFTREVQRKEDL